VAGGGARPLVGMVTFATGLALRLPAGGVSGIPEASAEEWRVLARVKVSWGSSSWPPA